jgi:hypothetical protein
MNHVAKVTMFDSGLESLEGFVGCFLRYKTFQTCSINQLIERFEPSELTKPFERIKLIDLNFVLY